ncbi:MAG: ribokinase [Gammaproteobacteria bacterium]
MIAEIVVCGSLNMDLVARVAMLPRPGETVAGHGLQRLPGGKGLNQAVAAARMGAKVAMIGTRGDDADGATLEALLAAEGIDTRGVLRRRPEPGVDASAMHTGLAQVMVADDGENAIIVHGGANATLTPEEVRAVLAALPHAGVAVAQLETPPDTVAAFFEAVRARGMRTLLNTAPALPDTRDLLALADIVVLNETELAHYAVAPSDDAGGEPRSLEAYAALARRLLDRPDQTIIVTLGEQGALCVTADGVIHHPAPQVKVVDTTGAGDCFCGVLAAMLARGLDLATAVPRAVAAASLAVTRIGAAPSMPRAAELA